MTNQTVLILDFGGQYKELIARRVRECGVFSLIKPGSMPVSEIRAMHPIGIILTGGPDSVYREDAPHCDPKLFEIGVPILGLCYGHQLINYTLGGVVSPCEVSEYGETEVFTDSSFVLFRGLDERQTVLMSHTDQVTELPEGFRTVAHTANCKNAAVVNDEKQIYGLQFHPEVQLSRHGMEMLHHFLYDVCHAAGDYSMDDYIETQIEEVRKKVGGDQVVLGLSGGVDSSVCAALLSRAIPNQLICIFVDHGFMRKNEGDEVEAAFAGKGVHFVRVNAKDTFMEALRGVSDPETKRKTIGRLFVETFQKEAKKYTGVRCWLAQGTIYPDVVESGANQSAVIKSHHNVGGLPEDMDFVGLVEPLRGLFKDEVRAVGRKLALSDVLVNRQPFPGPGLAIRVIGELTEEKLDILREADWIFREEIERAGVNANQYFAVLTNLRSVGVMGDSRTYDYTVALRAVITSDFMTAEYAKIPYPVLDRVSARIINEVDGVNRVVYDITGKPPATIEWE